MPGFVGTLNGVNYEDYVFSQNADFSGAQDSDISHGLTLNNEVWMGGTDTNPTGSHVNVMTLIPGAGIDFTYTAPVGAPQQFSKGTFEISATGVATSDYHVARFIVSNSGTAAADGAQYATIAAGYAAAVAASVGGTIPQTVFVQPGTYTENIVLSPGVDITAFVCDSSMTRSNESGMTGNVVIRGKLSASFTGRCAISNLWLEAIADYAIEITGANLTKLVVKGCSLIGVSNSIIHSTNVSGAWIGINNCYADLQAPGIAFWILSSHMDINYSTFNNSGGSTTVSTTASSGDMFLLFTQIASGITASGAFQAGSCSFGGTLTVVNAGNHILRQSRFITASASCLSIDATADCYAIQCVFDSSNTNVITGAGILRFSDISFMGSSSGINTTTQTVLVSRKGAYQVALPAGAYTVLASDEIVGVNTAAPRAITLTTTPATGQVVTIKDVTGGAAGSNITISPAAGLIDGAATKVISANYGSVTLFYSGIGWYSF